MAYSFNDSGTLTVAAQQPDADQMHAIFERIAPECCAVYNTDRVARGSGDYVVPHTQSQWHFFKAVEQAFQAAKTVPQPDTEAMRALFESIASACGPFNTIDRLKHPMYKGAYKYAMTASQWTFFQAIWGALEEAQAATQQNSA